VAGASVASSLHALAVRDIRDGLHHEGRRGWEFIELASLGNNRVRSYLIALLRILLYPVGLGVIVGVVVGVQNALAHRPFSGIGPVGGVILQFGTIIMIGIAVLRTVARTHRRPWLSLITPDRHLDWGRLGIGLGVELALKVVLLLVILTLTGKRFGPVSAGELTTIGLALLLVPFQAASEEILFRGYLTQSLGRFVPSRCVIAAIIGLLFGLLHLNTYGPLTVPYFFVLSLLYSLVSLRDRHWPRNIHRDGRGRRSRRGACRRLQGLAGRGRSDNPQRAVLRAQSSARPLLLRSAARRLNPSLVLNVLAVLSA
jgi:membrane protease YdiL (CAAX protease family)